jgi:hypothetical protein
MADGTPEVPQRGVGRPTRSALARRGPTVDDIVEWGQSIDPPSQMVELARAFRMDPIDLLVDGAGKSQAVYDSPPGPKAELAAARCLVEFYEVLESLAVVAPRARDGALLKEPVAGPLAPVPTPAERPWQPSRPRNVEDIPPFANVARWRQTIADADARALADRLGSPPKKRGAPSGPPSELQSGGRQITGRSLVDLPFLLYYGNYGKVITLVKTKDMTFTNEPGRVAILAYMIRAVCGDLKVYTDYTFSFGRDGEATAEQLASAMLHSTAIGADGSIMRLFFTAERNDADLLERLREGESMRILVEVSALRVISVFTDIRPEFLPAARAKPKGCGAIQWMQELMREVPDRYKALWAVRKYEADRGIYHDNFQPGQWMPLGEFMPLDDEESKKRQCLFLGTASGFADTVLIMTEEGRILQIDERARNLQSFCSAVLSVAPFIAMSYLVAAVGGLIIAGELLPAVLGELFAGSTRLLAPRLAAWEASGAVKWVDTLIASRRWEAIVNAGLGAASITFNVHEAGGVAAYLKKLKSPVQAGLFLLDLLSIRGAFKADDLARLIEENRVLARQLERGSVPKKAALELDRDTAPVGRALPEPAPTGRPVNTPVADRRTSPIPDRPPAPTQERMTTDPLVDARLRSSASSTRKEVSETAWPKDELAERRAALAAAQESKPVTTPVPIPPKREPIHASAEPSAASAKPSPVVAARTEDPIAARVPPDEIAAMRQRKQATAAQAHDEAAAEQRAAEAEDMPAAQQLASGDRPRMGPRTTPQEARKPRTAPKGSSSRPARGGIVVLESGARQAKEETRFKSLLELLRPFKKGATKRQLAFKYEPVARGSEITSTEECDVELIEHVAQARATEALERTKGPPYPREAFRANFAAFKVKIDGKSRILVARNTEQELHSEGWIVKRLEAEVGSLKIPSNAARVKVEQIFTERAPCAGQCEVVIGTYFKDAAVFFWVPKTGERWGAAAEALREYWLGITPLPAALRP